MTLSRQRRRCLQAGAAWCATLVAPTTRACEYFSPTLRVWHPWTRATAADSAFAVLHMTFDEVTRRDRLVAASTPIAGRVELAGPGLGPAIDLDIPMGQDLVLSEHGVHLRLFELNRPLEVGRSYPLKLGFEHGGLVQATLNVDFARFI
jgi:hypothetical protein